jgi:hypothetical protein
MSSGIQAPGSGSTTMRAPRVAIRKVHRIVILALVVAPCAMAGAQIMTLLLSDDVESIVVSDGHRPIRPVSNTYGVGDLHTVSFRGEVGNAVCRSSRGGTVSGEGENKVIASVAIAESNGQLQIPPLDGESSGRSVTHVEVRLVNIQYIKAPSESDLRRVLKEELIPTAECQVEINEKIEAGYCLAQIFSIMIADGTYELTGNAQTDISVEPRKLDAVIRAHLGYEEEIFKMGKALHYGVQMDSLCLTPNDAVLVRTVPDYRWWLFTPLKNLFHTAWKVVFRSGAEPIREAVLPDRTIGATDASPA